MLPSLFYQVPGHQQNQAQPTAENNTLAPRASDPPLPNASAGAAKASAPPEGGTAAVNGDKSSDAGRAAATAATTAAPAPAAPAADKARPSNSFEKIMLRLSTMYPNFTR